MMVHFFSLANFENFVGASGNKSKVVMGLIECESSREIVEKSCVASTNGNN